MHYSKFQSLLCNPEYLNYCIRRWMYRWSILWNKFAHEAHILTSSSAARGLLHIYSMTPHQSFFCFVICVNLVRSSVQSYRSPIISNWCFSSVFNKLCDWSHKTVVTIKIKRETSHSFPGYRCFDKWPKCFCPNVLWRTKGLSAPECVGMWEPPHSGLPLGRLLSYDDCMKRPVDISALLGVQWLICSVVSCFILISTNCYIFGAL